MQTRDDAQMIMLSTAGTEQSVWWLSRVQDGREMALAHTAGDCERSGVAYLEWAADPDSDLDDETLWPSFMPALGRTVSLRHYPR